jgi:hypothetical protein
LPNTVISLGSIYLNGFMSIWTSVREQLHIRGLAGAQTYSLRAKYHHYSTQTAHS